MPIGLKDLCYTTFAPTAGGTTIHARFVPSFNATIVDRLEHAGAVTLGKLKMTEGAYTSHHPDDQAPLNPWGDRLLGRLFLKRIGRGDFGGTLLRLDRQRHRRLDPVSVGDVRVDRDQAHLGTCEPPRRLSVGGLLDHVGPMCRSAADAAAMLGVIAGADVNDPTALQAPVPNYLAGIGDGVRGLRIGVDRNYTQDGIDPQVVAALLEAERTLADLGADIREVKFPAYEKLVSMWIPMCSDRDRRGASRDLSVAEVGIRPGSGATDRAGQVDEWRRDRTDPS